MDLPTAINWPANGPEKVRTCDFVTTAFKRRFVYQRSDEPSVDSSNLFDSKHFRKEDTLESRNEEPPAGFEYGPYSHSKGTPSSTQRRPNPLFLRRAAPGPFSPARQSEPES